MRRPIRARHILHPGVVDGQNRAALQARIAVTVGRDRQPNSIPDLDLLPKGSGAAGAGPCARRILSARRGALVCHGDDPTDGPRMPGGRGHTFLLDFGGRRMLSPGLL